MNRPQFPEYEFFDHPAGFGKTFLLRTEWKPSYLSMIKSERPAVFRILWNALHLFSRKPQEFDNIVFLGDLQGIQLKGLEVTTPYCSDLTPISNLSSIEYLAISGTPYKKLPDLQLLPDLQVVNIGWRAAAKSVLQLTRLRELQLIEFPDKNLERLKMLRSLHKLQLSNVKLSTLDGIEYLESLIELDIFSCRSLVSLDGIQNMKSLQKVTLNRCNNITSETPFSDLVSFESLA